MLKLQNIVKDYPAGDTVVHALRGVSLQFRKSEFVAVLGHSGCGKTTLLNIIGGLDQYTSGDLIINGKSTKNFTDGDWDSYRNHSIGFVFQSYNLIPHQSVLSNVELALTFSGVSKAERRERAKKVLEQVGLADQLYKRPNQLSGGQMQRVAIARALVNDPDILMADEPTGALDSETSVQIMEILKEISKDKLIIMVTHNPELADAYANRIIRLSDGEIISDSNPYEEAVGPDSMGKLKRISMSFFSALGLSLNNLLTKKTRTILTAFAGSIGIIGIALILSLSNGIQTYIDKVQEDTLSSYPITIEAESMDMTAMVTSLMGATAADSEENRHELDAVYSNTILYDLVNSLVSTEAETNNLTAFKEFLDNDEAVKEFISSVQYTYDLNKSIYAKDADGNIFKSDVADLLNNAMGDLYGGGDFSSAMAMGAQTPMGNMEVWEEMLPPENYEEGGPLINELLTEQYDIIHGRWPEKYDEIVLIVNKDNEISDLVIYCLGLGTQDAIDEVMQSVINMEKNENDYSDRWTYDEICEKTYKVVLPAEHYQYDSATGTYRDISDTAAGMDFLYNSEDIGTTVKVVGIVRPNEDAVSSMMTGAIGYTSALTQHLLNKCADMEIIEKQVQDPATDVITGLPFLTEDYFVSVSQKIDDIKEYIANLSVTEKSALYIDLMSQPADEYVDTIVSQKMEGLTREYVEQMVVDTYAQQMGVDADTVMGYIAQMDDETLFGYVEESIREQVVTQYAAGVQQQMGAMTAEQLAGALDLAMTGDEQTLQYAGVQAITPEQYVWMYDNYMPPTVSESTYEDNLDLLGKVDVKTPKTINIYASTFADKDNVADAIDRYNDGVEEEDKITYTDYVALLMSSITTIINAISYVLIAFVAISLVVSSIMIGIITYISVLERTKEIGILRAIGASKRDISRVFNAETLIVGFVAGAIGIGLTLLLIIPINAIIFYFTEIASLKAILPTEGAVILVIISMVLTFVAGLIPSGIAARKDPVEALRTE